VTADAVTVDDGNSGGNYNVSYANNSSSTILAANLAISHWAERTRTTTSLLSQAV
jgi:hypothetical protein